MALASSYLSVADWALYQADKPIILAASALASPTVGLWNAEGDPGGTDHVDPLYPIKRAGDRRAGSWTAPDADYVEDDNEIALMLEVDPAAGIDTFALLNHNLDEVKGGQLLSLKLALSDDGSTWTTVLNTTVAPNVWAWSTAQRFVSFKLNHTAASSDGVNARLYTGAIWARITVTHYATAGGGTVPVDLAAAPHFGEVLLGQRRQLPRKPDAPWDDDDAKTEAADFVAETGSRTRVIRSDGQHVEDCTFTFADSTEAAVLRAAHKEAKRGGYPVLWTPAPYSAPARSFFGFMPLQLQMPFDEDGQIKRTANFTFEEAAPYVASEEA